MAPTRFPPETNGAAFIRDTGIETAWYHIVNSQKPYRVGYKKSARAKAKYFEFKTEDEAKVKIDQLMGEY